MLASELSTPLLGINDPFASLLHFGSAAWFGWQAQQLVGRADSARRRAALAIFAASAVVVLGISATYHGMPFDHPWKEWLQRIDHAAIFLLIAATVTSFHSICLSGRGRVWMVGLVWAAALAALVSMFVFWSSLSTDAGLLLYFGLTAVGMSSLAFLPRRVPLSALLPLAIGVVLYVAGALTDAWTPRWLIARLFGAHEIFHLAVVVALVLHWRFFHDWALPIAERSSAHPTVCPAAEVPVTRFPG